MQSRITGATMPVLEFALDPNGSIISGAGELSWMSSSIQMTTHTQFAGGGGLFAVLKRVAGGSSIFMTEYRAVGPAAELAFATKLPGHILPVEVGPVDTSFGAALRIRGEHQLPQVPFTFQLEPSVLGAESVGSD
jgi:uncharacterized protein (AIM24 family)